MLVPRMLAGLCRVRSLVVAVALAAAFALAAPDAVLAVEVIPDIGIAPADWLTAIQTTVTTFIEVALGVALAIFFVSMAVKIIRRVLSRSRAIA
jgi:hypothetical protein